MSALSPTSLNNGSHPLASGMHIMGVAVLLAGCLMFSKAQANIVIPVDPPTPTLANLASTTPTLYSRAIANSTFSGTLQESCTGSNSQAWSCRAIIESLDPVANSIMVETVTTSTVEAFRGTDSFNFDDNFADYTIATSEARAQTDYGSNKVEALARNAVANWSETRIEDISDSTLRTEGGFTSSSYAAAQSVWTDVIEADSDGTINLVFSLQLHAANIFTSFSGITPIANPEMREGYGSGALTVQLFDLNAPVTYGDGENSPYIEGYALVADGMIELDATSPDGTTFLELLANVTAGGKYSLVTELSVEAENNARLDLFGTASLDRIEVAPDQVLTFASGTAYNVSAVPEPGTLLMSLVGLGCVAVRLRLRRQRLTHLNHPGDLRA